MAGKQLNKKLVVGLSLGAFLLIILFSVLMLRQLQHKDPKYFVELAEASAAQEQWVQAATFYDLAWKAGGDARYLMEVGEMQLREGEVNRALFFWRQTLVQQPDLIDAHLRQLTLLLQLSQLYGTPQRWQNVREAAEALLAVATGNTEDHEAFGHHAKGMALLSTESLDAANAETGLAELTQATTLAPKNVEYVVDLAAQWVRAERFDEAEKLYRELLGRQGTAGPDASRARLGYAGFLATRQRFDEAESHFAESIKLAAGDEDAVRDAQLGYAQFLSQRWARSVRDRAPKEVSDPLFAQAESILRECTDASPTAFEPYISAALLYKAAARHTDVVELCERRIRQGLSRKGAEATKNRVSTFTLMIYASEACVALGVAASESGDLAAKERWLTKAEQYVADARGESSTHPRVRSQSARVKLARGQDREALSDLRAADEAYGAFETVSWENKMLLAQVHLRLNEPGAAKTVLESVIDRALRYRGRDPLFWNLYAQTLFLSNELDRSLAICDRVLLLDPRNTDARRLKAAVYERQGKHKEAGTLEQELTGSGAVAAMLSARAAMLSGDGEGAINILKKALEQDPADVRLVGATVKELIDRDRHDEAQSIVANALASRPDDRRIQRLAILARRDLKPEERDRATLELIEGEEDAFQRDLDLIAYHSQHDDLGETLRVIDDAEKHLIAKDTPLARSSSALQHAALLKAKIRAAADLNDEVAMTAARDAAAKYNVDGSGGKSILGWFHFQRREYELALNAYREAVVAQPTDPSAFAHLGQNLQVLGRIEEAQSAYEQAVRINPNEGMAHQGLALLAQIRGEQAVFRRELDECDRIMPNDPWVQEQMLIRMEEANPADAVKRREAKLAESPDDLKSLQRLAVLYEKVQDRVRADQTHARLVELKPDDDRIIVDAAGYYRRTDRPDTGLEFLHTFAASRDGAEARAKAQLLIANEWVQQRKLDLAEKCLLEADGIVETVEVAQGLGELYARAFRDPTKAAPWYLKAVGRARAAKNALATPLLESAIACLLTRTVNDVPRAKQLVDELRTGFPDFPRGLLWQSEIHAREGNVDAAIASLSEYLVKRPNETYALLQRAKHQLSRGRLAAAIEDLETAKRVKPLDLELQPRLLLSRLHARSGRKDLWLAELESMVKDAPDNPVANEALAEAYLQEGKLADADRLVTAQINRTADAPDARWFFLRGRISLELKEPDKAVAEFRRGAEVSGFSAESVLKVLNLYLRTGRFAPGIEYFERYASAEKSSPALVSRHAQLLAKGGARGKAVEEFRRATAMALSESTKVVQEVVSDVLSSIALDEAVEAFSSGAPEGALARANERILLRLHAATGNFDEGVRRVDTLLRTAETDRERAALLHEKGDLLQGAAKSEGALQAYQEALKHDPDNWISLNNVAYLLSDLKGARGQALPFAERAVKAEENAFTLDTLGWIYVGLRRYTPAIAELSRAVQLNPDYALPYYHLGEAYRRNGQFAEGMDVLSDAREVAQVAKEKDVIELVEAAQGKIRERDSKP